MRGDLNCRAPLEKDEQASDARILMKGPAPVGAGKAFLCLAAFSPGEVLGLVGKRGAIRTEAGLLTCAVQSGWLPWGTGPMQAAAA